MSQGCEPIVRQNQENSTIAFLANGYLGAVVRPV